MIEIGHNLQHAIEFVMLLSAMVAVMHIAVTFGIAILKYRRDE
ncbi:MAG: hypothetical protein ABF768_08075 [Leuconostoc falkenbergense]